MYALWPTSRPTSRISATGLTSLMELFVLVRGRSFRPHFQRQRKRLPQRPRKLRLLRRRLLRQAPRRLRRLPEGLRGFEKQVGEIRLNSV